MTLEESWGIIEVPLAPRYILAFPLVEFDFSSITRPMGRTQDSLPGFLFPSNLSLSFDFHFLSSRVPAVSLSKKYCVSSGCLVS